MPRGIFSMPKTRAQTSAAMVTRFMGAPYAILAAL